MHTSSATSMSLLFSTSARRQRYLDIEAALALAQSDLGVIPQEAAEQIASTAHLHLLDTARIDADELRTAHPLMPLISELARVVGEPAGGWVHWGATTQNIQQTADVLGLRRALDQLTGQLCGLLGVLTDLTERSAEMVMAGRTHGQQAVPITFGFKVVVWTDALLRHLERVTQLRVRLLTAMMGGAVGNFASLGEIGPAVQREVAQRLALTPMPLPARSLADPFAELVCVLGLLAATGATIASEIARLMATEFGEVSEALGEGDIGSSTMPQKRNPKRSAAVITLSAQIRSLVPLALEAVIQSHEVEGARTAMLDAALEQGCVLSDDLLRTLTEVVQNLELHPERMAANLRLSGGLISAEAVMMALGSKLGRQNAHEVVHHAAREVTLGAGPTFLELLAADPRVRDQLSRDELAQLLDPAAHTGLSAALARETSGRARETVERYRKQAELGV
ncbi:lyase family protein [Deinococcus alpinitundrae]|uniref:lyase family protein n=1 Tax=Deinococcus alpinitundrae TaxID=468913 RepID=UPI00137A5CCA|nr:adenylosuccinate lyase family protein [Deinococcus alpinitundrae]